MSYKQALFAFSTTVDDDDILSALVEAIDHVGMDVPMIRPHVALKTIGKA